MDSNNGLGEDVPKGFPDEDDMLSYDSKWPDFSKSRPDYMIYIKLDDGFPTKSGLNICNPLEKEMDISSYFKTQ